MKHMKHKT